MVCCGANTYCKAVCLAHLHSLKQAICLGPDPLDCCLLVQGQPPSVPFDGQALQNLFYALDQAFNEELEKARARKSEFEQPFHASHEVHSIVPNSLRKGWTPEASQVMQIVEDLQAQLRKEDQQRKANMQEFFETKNFEFETDFVERIQQYQEKLQSYTDVLIDARDQVCTSLKDM